MKPLQADRPVWVLLPDLLGTLMSGYKVQQPHLKGSTEPPQSRLRSKRAGLTGTASQDFISSFTGRGAWRGCEVSILGDNSKPSSTEPEWSPLLSLLCDSRRQRSLPASEAFAGASDAAFGEKHFCPCRRKKLEVLKLNLAEMTLKTLIYCGEKQIKIHH